jgi:sporulation protein YlmC with PRC-barrel domain
MGDSKEASPGTDPDLQEFSSVLTGFDVVDRNGERVGTVKRVNLARTCIVVETGKWRKQSHAVHVSAVDGVDVDGFTISLAVTAADVSDAPEFRELDDECEAAITRYYRGLK